MSEVSLPSSQKEKASEALVLDRTEIQAAIQSLADAIFKRHGETLSRLILVGIPTRGVEVARRVLDDLSKKNVSHVPELGILDISMHRDDLATRAKITAIKPTELPLNMDGRIVVIVDDVAFTGRTCRAAMDAIQSFGRPSRIEFAVLVDRGHRELPICPTYIGRKLETEATQRIRVRFENLDGISDSVYLLSA